mmetsp:Transcript_26104/g.62904  ORF Transcript_26104/g.62904 Transcript_26104/m.62904 type:complete len:494 (-) Transcript_26104:129-1610(-)|eukprot:CAMPEP_0114508046 /NCGR_PEP_ID=MMETSP0109-20121206/12365_1 /TAXON_ID=29199 /ORGANISM="Chlorarachnion reptans, Strain CCCM449" /LENGTH=493 /DNA_ID=CAMNT_0001686901 /DNA_START=596 /DNA_END=2077 /DNA_ORIENTATION=+
MDFKHLCLLVASEKEFEGEWRDEKGEWKTAELREEIQNVKKSYFQVEFPRDSDALGLRFVGRKVIHVTPGSLAARCGIKPNIFFVKINGTSVPNKTSSINAMLRLALKKQDQSFVITFRPLTKREALREMGDGGARSTPSQSGVNTSRTQSTVDAQEHEKRKAEIESLKRRIETEVKLRENEKQQAEIWKQLLNKQIEELERARDASKAQVTLANEQISRARDTNAELEKEKESLQALLKEAKGELKSAREKITENEREIQLLKTKGKTCEDKNIKLEEAVKVQKEQLEDITQMFNNGQKLMLAAHKKIGELESQLKKSKEAEITKTLERKEEEIVRLKKRVEDLVNLTGKIGASASSPRENDKRGPGRIISEEDLDFKALYNEVDTTTGIHGVVVLLVSHCAGLVEKSHQERLRHLFAALGYRYEEVDGAMEADLRKNMTTKSGITSYPQVFVRSGEGEDAGYVFIGDFDKVFEMNELGKIHQIFRGCALKS